MAERQKPDEKSDDAAKSKYPRGADKAQSGPSAGISRVTEEMAESYFGYVEALTRIQQEAIERHWDMLREYAAELGRLQSDLAAADPRGAFLSDLLRAYKNSDPKGVLEAYTALSRHAAQMQAMSEKRYRDIAKNSVSRSQALVKDVGDKVIDQGREYGKKVMAVFRKVDVEDLDPTAKVALAQALMVSAVLRPRGSAEH